MAANQSFPNARHLNVPVASGVVSGDPVVVGSLAGVAETTRDADGNATVDFLGAYSLSVKGANDAGNSAVAIGDKLYFVAADTPKISKKSSGQFFGYALAAITSGSTATIAVKTTGNAALGALDVPAKAVTIADLSVFKSTEATGTGSSQNIAHGLGVVPGLIFFYPSDTSPSTAGVYTLTEGTHTTTNIVVTVTSGKKFFAVAIA